MATRKDGKGRALRKGEHYRKSDGRYSYSYNDVFGNRKFIYSNNLAKLREREEQLVRDQLDGLDVYVAGSADLNFVFDRYISTKSELRSTTRSNYLYTWNHFIRDGFGKKKIGDIKYSDVLYFYNYLITEKKLQISSIESINTVLHPTFQLAVRDDIIRKNPTDGAYAEIKKRNGGTKKTRHALSVEQQRSFMNYVADSPIFYTWYPLFAFLLGTGCRISEALGLTWDNIDFENASVYIDHQIIYKKVLKEGGAVRHYAEPPKNRTNRTIPLQKEILNIMRKHKQQTYFMSKASGCEVDGYKDFVFLNRNLKLYTPNTFTRALHNIRDTYNRMHEEDNEVMLPDFSAHTFRHTFCT